MIRALVIILLISVSENLMSQEVTSEKLTSIYKNSNLPDSTRVDAAIDLADRIVFLDLDSAHTLIIKARNWSIRSNYKYGLARVYGYLGFIYHNKGEIGEAIENYTISINYNLVNGFELERAMDLGNYGSLLDEMDDPKAKSYILQSIAIYEKYDRKEDLAFLYGKLATNFSLDNINDSALYYYNKVLRQDVSANARLSSLLGISKSYANVNKADSADYYANSAIKYALIINDSSKIKAAYQVKFNAKFKLKDFDSAVYFFNKAKVIQTNNIGLIHQFCTMSARLFESQGKMDKAFFYLDSAYQLNELLKNQEMTQMAFREAMKQEYNEKHYIDSINYKKEEELQAIAYEQDLKQEARQRYFLYFGLGLMAFVMFIVFRSYRQKKRDNSIIAEQKTEVEHQKTLVDAKNKEILDSIQYAQRIQVAILPSRETIQKHLPNSFIYYRPKDIVAGDFYWIEESLNGVIFAAADCTGHGVPGAMVSVVCNNALNRSVREYNLTNPGDILNKTRDLVIEEFAKSNDDVKDGMDIALCTIEGSKLCYSGANRPLWIIRNNEIIELSANKQPIGKYEVTHPFEQHEITLKKDDLIYIFSDGYSDQFGGPKGKKFKSINLKKLLLSIHQLSMDKQKSILNQTFEDYKGELEQIDDVCIIGVRI